MTSQDHVGTYAFSVPIVGHEYRVSRIRVCHFFGVGCHATNSLGRLFRGFVSNIVAETRAMMSTRGVNFIPTAGSIAEPSEILLCFRGQMPNGQSYVPLLVLCTYAFPCSLHTMAVTPTMYVFENDKFILLTERSVSRRVLFRRLRGLGSLSGIR
jgi:hypothetical protein